VKQILCVLFIVLLMVPAMADQKKKPDDAFKVVLFTLGAGTMVDYAITTYALNTGKFKEGNKLASWYVEKPTLAIPIILGATYLQSKVLESLRRDNKTIAYIIAGMLFIIRGYIIYHNLRLINR